jgi:hypothetical protein
MEPRTMSVPLIDSVMDKMAEILKFFLISEGVIKVALFLAYYDDC